MSLLAIVVYRRAPRARVRPLPPYPQPETAARRRRSFSARRTIRPLLDQRARPEWLTIPQRGLYTGIMILGAVGTGKTSACMYPYVDQLLRWRGGRSGAQDRRPRPGSEGRLLRPGAVASSQRGPAATRTTSRSGSTPASATTRCTTSSIPTPWPTPIATLLNNLFGRSKEPFWQQAYTDLLKFVILLRRISDGYTTFSEVYRYILDDQQIDRDIRRLKADLAEPPDVARHPAAATSASTASRSPGRTGSPEDPDHMAHPYEAEPGDVPRCAQGGRTRSGSRRAPGGPHASTSSTPSSAGIVHGWSRLDGRLRSSIVEGVVVFLSLFDDNPAVHRAFCPPRSAYTDDPPARRTEATRHRSTRCSRAGRCSR